MDKKIDLLITRHVTYGNGNSDASDFGYNYQISDLAEALNDIERDLDTISGRSRGGIKNVEYVIYQVESARKNDNTYMENTLSQGTDYFIKYNSCLEVQEVCFDGLSFKGEIVKEYESYKVLNYEDFDDFIDGIVYNLEKDYDIEVPNYELLKDTAFTLLQNGEIQEAKEKIICEILEFSEVE